MGKAERERGRRVKEARGKDSQQTAAKRCGMSQSQWSKIERGVLGKTSWLPDIAKCYGVSVEWLVYGYEPKYMPKKTDNPDLKVLAKHAPILAERLAGRLPADQLRTLSHIVDALVERKLSDEDFRTIEAIVRRFTAK